MQFITSIIATISLLSLAIYDFLCICRIIGKEKIAEKIWSYILPNKTYDEKRLFLLIRPGFLYVSLITFVLSGGVATKIAIYNVIIRLAPLLSVGCAIRNNRENN